MLALKHWMTVLDSSFADLFLFNIFFSTQKPDSKVDINHLLVTFTKHHLHGTGDYSSDWVKQYGVFGGRFSYVTSQCDYCIEYENHFFVGYHSCHGTLEQKYSSIKKQYKKIIIKLLVLYSLHFPKQSTVHLKTPYIWANYEIGVLGVLGFWSLTAEFEEKESILNINILSGSDHQFITEIDSSCWLLI